MRIPTYAMLLMALLVSLPTGTTLAADALRKPDLASWIDQRFASHLATDGGELVVVDDATFLRRVYLDLSGRIPAVAELRDFIRDTSADKRIRVVDRLLAHERFETHTARVWRRILMPPGSAQNPALARDRARQLDEWLQSQLRQNVGYDDMARRLVTAGGADVENAERIAKEIEAMSQGDQRSGLGMLASLRSTPTVYLQHAGGQPASMASSVSRVFLGVRLECAQCHDHPFTDWTQQDFWGVAAFFAGARLTPQQARPAPDTSTTATVSAPMDNRQTMISDEAGTSYQTSLPWDDAETVSVPADELPRQYFANWMTSPDNPQFAATAVNRVWQQLCGRGLTDSVDDLDQATNADRAILLDDLAQKFAESGFDLKELVRAICTSDYYQRASEKRAQGSPLTPRPLKVMTPEQLFDSFEIAAAMPISSIDNGPRFNGEMDALVSRMEEAIGNRPDDFRSGIPQALSLMNGPTTSKATDLKKSKTLRAIVDAPFLAIPEKVDTLFLATLSRTPHASERASLLEYINQRPSDQEKAEAFSEVLWALINCEEFVLVR